MNLDWKDKLGEGQTGVVWHAYDKDLQRDVAVKFFTFSLEADSSDLQAYTTTLTSIVHPNVVAVHAAELLHPPFQNKGDADMPEAELALVMEYVPGLEFADWIQEPELSKSDIEKALVGILDGLDAFHRAKAHHGDLHARNIRISGNMPKLIDPMYRNPSVVMSTIESTESQKKDLRDAIRLISQALARLTGVTTLQGEIPLLSDENLTTQSIRDALVSSLSNTSNRNRPDRQATRYEEFRKIQAKNNTVEWQESTKTIRRHTYSSILEWRDKYSNFAGSKYEDWKDPFHDGIVSITPLIELTLAASETPSLQSFSSRDLIFEVLSTEWPMSGPDPLTDFPQSCLYVLHSLVGATLLANGSLQAAVEQLYTSVHVYTKGDDVALINASGIASHPRIFGGDALAGWKFLTELYESLDVLPRVFSSESEYNAALTAYQICMTLCEFLTLDKSTINALVSRQTNNIFIQIWPGFMFSGDASIRRAITMINRNGGFSGSLLDGHASRSGFNRDHWKLWLDTLRMYVIRQNRSPLYVPDQLGNLKVQ